MSESFFRRWSRRKAESAPNPASPDSAGSHAAADAQAAAGPGLPAAGLPAAGAPGNDAQHRLPSMKDVASLVPDSDYSLFVARGVDQSVRRAAMKKLFSDPHFNVMDGLDIYIDDYTKPSPLPPGMLEALQHAKSTLDPKPLYKTSEEDDEGDAQDLDRQADGDESDTLEEHDADTEAETEAEAEAEAEADVESEADTEGRVEALEAKDKRAEDESGSAASEAMTATLTEPRAAQAQAGDEFAHLGAHVPLRRPLTQSKEFPSP